MIAGALVVVALALVAIIFTALLLASSWNALREELLPSFRIDPPGLRAICVTLFGMVLPVILTALFTGYLAIWVLRMLLKER
jgi:hypothetical protein